MNKKLFFACALFILIVELRIGFAQMQTHYDAGFKLSVLSKGNFEFGAGLALSEAKARQKPQFYVPELTIAATISGETYKDVSKTRVAPKVSLEVHRYIVGGRLGWVQYQNQALSNNRFFAEIGVSFFGLLHTGYERYFQLQKEYNSSIPLGRFFLARNLPFFKIKG